jgi:hypothetical protein
MSDALSRMMAPRPTTPEQLRLKQPASNSCAYVVAQHLKASTTDALTFMYRSVIEKGHAMQIVNSPLPCWVRKGAATPAEARRLWNNALAKFDKAQFRDQPFSISVRTQVTAHQLACELHSRTNPPIQRVLQSSRGNPERVEASHLCKCVGCAQLGHSVFEGAYYNSSRNHCNTIHCIHEPKCFMPLAGLTVAEAAGQHSPSPAAAAAADPLSPSKSQLKKEIRSLKRELAEAKEALRARETTPPSGRKRATPAMSSAEKRARGSGMFQSGVIPSPSM